MQKSSFKDILSEREKELAERTEELEAQREELQAAVEAVSMKNKHLEQTLSKLNTINREVDEIVYRSAHDLKTPISAIEGLFHLMEIDEENMALYIAQARKSIRESKHLLKTMARYSKNLVKPIETNEIVIEDMWDQILSELKEMPHYHGVKISFRSSVSIIRTDKFRLSQMLYHLVRNSIDYRKDDARIDVDISHTGKENYIEIKVIDNGLGIPYNIQNHVFDMFYRGSTISTGAGLGLYLCKRIVDILDGNISLVSYPDVGTTVTANIPIPMPN